MWRIVAGVILILHGLIHLMCFAAYFRLARITGLPYPSHLLGGRAGVSSGIVGFLVVLWLVAVAGFLVGAAGLLTGNGWWRPVVIATALLALCALGWPDAWAGVFVDVVILAAILIATFARARRVIGSRDGSAVIARPPLRA